MNIKLIKMFLLFLLSGTLTFAQEQQELAIGTPSAMVDLRTKEGVTLLKAQWSTVEAKIVPTLFRAAGPSKEDTSRFYPTGSEISTFDLKPRFGTPDFEQAKWEMIDANSLEKRRGTGKLAHVWYRIKITIPEKVAAFKTEGSRAFFEIVADDYSEVWLNGKINKTFGNKTGGTIAGFNARQRVWLGDNLKPNTEFDIVILVTNGPLADLPDNYNWIRSATIDFYKERPTYPVAGKIIPIDKEVEQILDTKQSVQKIASGFQFTEGPVWSPEGYLLFSDPNANVIYKYEPSTDNVSIYQTKSGYTGMDIGEYHQPGSNGLGIDLEGRVVACQHGNRRIVRFEKKGPVTVLADKSDGKKLNSPNDLVVKNDGSIYFTDPPYGLPNLFDDKRKEQKNQGVYRVKNGVAEQLAIDLGGPNGLAFSPNEQYLYVTNWDIRNIHNTKAIWRYEVTSTGTLKNGKEFFNMNNTEDEDGLDGIKVDLNGNLFVSAPGGIWIISSTGKFLGKVICEENPSNMAWGNDGKTLYITARTSLYKIRTNTGGKIATKSK
jgi:gluconolactonase